MLKQSIETMLDCLLTGRVSYIDTVQKEGKKYKSALLPVSSHHYIECAILAGGAAKINLADRTVELASDRLLVILPETRHCEGYTRKTRSYSILWTAITPGGVGFFLSNYRSGKGRESGKRFSTVFPESRQLWKASQLVNLPDDILSRGRFISPLIAACTHAIENMDKSTFSENEYKKQMVMQVKSYLDAHFTRQIALSEVAQMVRHSPNYTNSLFQKFAGKPIREYIIEKRLNKAAHLLKTTDFQIKKVSRISGFNDPLYFSRVFRRHFSYSPAAWRRRQG